MRHTVSFVDGELLWMLMERFSHPILDEPVQLITANETSSLFSAEHGGSYRLMSRHKRFLAKYQNCIPVRQLSPTIDSIKCAFSDTLLQTCI